MAKCRWKDVRDLHPFRECSWFIIYYVQINYTTIFVNIILIIITSSNQMNLWKTIWLQFFHYTVYDKNWIWHDNCEPASLNCNYLYNFLQKILYFELNYSIKDLTTILSVILIIISTNQSSIRNYVGGG